MQCFLSLSPETSPHKTCFKDGFERDRVGNIRIWICCLSESLAVWKYCGWNLDFVADSYFWHHSKLLFGKIKATCFYFYISIIIKRPLIIVFLWQLWILRTKANLETQVNMMISMECVGRVLFCLSYFYKAWILTLSPILGLSNLPHPFHCSSAGILTYVLGVGIVIFNLLTNVLRYVGLKVFNYLIDW